MKRIIVLIIFIFSFLTSFAESHPSLNKTDTSELVKICKVWGFLKYHHPALATGKIDWDQELINLLNKTHEGHGKQYINHLLENLTDALGKVRDNKANHTYNYRQATLLPDNSWIYDTTKLGNTLSKKLIQIESVKRKKNSYYFQYIKEEGLAIPTNEKSYQDTCLDEGFRLLSLFRFWNVIQYYYPYKEAIGEPWDSILYQYIPKFINITTNKEYILTLMNLTAEVKDAHISVKDQESVFGVYTIPLIISFIENRYVVTGYYLKALYDNCPINIGDEILEINEKPVSNIINELLPYCSDVNTPTKFRIACDKLVLTDKTEISLKISNQYGVTIKNIVTTPSCQINSKARFQEERAPVIIKDSIAYIYIGSLTNEILEGNISEILNSIGVIIDLRGYPIDDAIGNLLDYFLPKEHIKFYQTSMPNIAFPGVFNFEKDNPSFYIFSERKESYSGRLVVLVDERTQSTSEFYAMMASVIPNKIIIGSQTAGSDGPAVPLILPNNVLVKYTAVGVYYPDYSKTQRIGISRDEDVFRTIAGVRSGIDPLIKRGVEIIKIF
ncbi:MAG: S41 family peptidase [Bacteroidales bacterium]|nr:S41 family peptidase [Bacteroidales bacterium]